MNEITRVTEESPAAEVTVAGDREIAVAQQPDSLLSAIVLMAKDPAVDVQKLSALLAMQERLEARDAERQFNQAMFRVQSRLKPMVRQGTVDLGQGKGSYKFLRREDLDGELRPIMEAEGFSVSFTQKAAPSGGLIVYGTVRHIAGHSETSEMELPPDTGPGRSPLQARVSTISFCERVLTEMIFNVVRKGQDDDGVAGGKKFITEEQVQVLLDLMKKAGREEGSFLQKLFAGEVHRAEEIEAAAFIVVKNTLEGIINQRKQKAAAP